MWLVETRRLLAASPPRRLPAPSSGRTAVLAPLYVAAGQLWVLLTRRAGLQGGEPGSLAFPGATLGETEGEDEVAAALRGARVEVGLEEKTIVVLGRLDDIWTQGGGVLSPFVGAVPHPHGARPAGDDVEALVPLPFAYLANPEAVEERQFQTGRRNVRSPVFHYRSHLVRGATALVVADLVGRLTGGAVGER